MKDLAAALRKLHRMQARESEKAQTMRGIPNDIDYQRGYADGIAAALTTLEGKP